MQDEDARDDDAILREALDASTPEMEVPADFADTVLGAIESEPIQRAPKRWRGALALAAAMLVFAGSGRLPRAPRGGSARGRSHGDRRAIDRSRRPRGRGRRSGHRAPL